jgi:hypothetical protein
MDFGLGDILQSVGLAANIFGSGKEKVNTTSTGGYETLPQYLKDAYEKVYYPAVQKQFEKPFQTEPTVRYTEQDPLFRSQAVSNYQSLSDDIGGLFPAFQAPSHLQQKPEQATTQATIQDAGQSAQAMKMAQAAMMGNFGDRTNRGSSSIAFLNRPGSQDRIRSMQMMDGKVNPFTGETVNANEAMDALAEMEASGKGNSLFSQAYKDYNDPLQVFSKNLNAAEYDPTDTFLSQLAPMIAGTLIGAPFMANPAISGLLSKAIGQGGSMLARGAK